MARTQKQKKIVKELLRAVAEQRLRVKKEMKEAVLYAVAMRKVGSELQALLKKVKAKMKE